MEMVITCKNLAKQYANGVWGIRNFTRSFQTGEMIALVGANGAGKSTLIHLLSGVLMPTNGVLSIKQMQKPMGWVSQHPVVDWFLNVERNIILGPRLAGYNPGESKTMARRALEEVGLGENAKKQPDQLSGGQQQRLQIARAISFEPEVLLLDEPTTGLDPHFSEKFLGRLSKRAKAGAMVLISSHDLDLLESYCNQIIYLVEGEVIFDGSVKDFLEIHKKEEFIQRQRGELRNVFLSLSNKNKRKMG